MNEEEKTRIELYSELNVLRAIDYEEFFGEMELTEEQIDYLIQMAEEFEEDYLHFIVWMEKAIDSEETDYTGVKENLAKEWRETTLKYLFDTGFVDEYVNMFADNAVESTLRNVSNPWYFSDDRAKFNAENEALTVFNRGMFLDAVENGYTMKRWCSLLDGRERHTHLLADGQEVGLFDLFQVGAAKMLYPRDIQNARMHPRETVNCRCFMLYF